MSETSSIKAQVVIPGKSNGKLQKMLTLEMITDWIKMQGFDEYTTNGLIEMAERYPTQALPSFRRNFNLMIERVRVKRRKEARGQNQIEEKNTTELLKETSSEDNFETHTENENQDVL